MLLLLLLSLLLLLLLLLLLPLQDSCLGRLPRGCLDTRRGALCFCLAGAFFFFSLPAIVRFSCSSFSLYALRLSLFRFSALC